MARCVTSLLLIYPQLMFPSLPTVALDQQYMEAKGSAHSELVVSRFSATFGLEAPTRMRLSPVAKQDTQQ